MLVREYYSLEDAAAAFGCRIADLIYFGANDKLPIYAIIPNLKLCKDGHWKSIAEVEDSDRFPHSLTTNGLVRLWTQTLANIEASLAHGEKVYCDVVQKVDKATGQECTYNVTGRTAVTPENLYVMHTDLFNFKQEFEAENGKYESLQAAIRPHIEKAFHQLPIKLAQRVAKDFDLHWDSLTPKQRDILASQHDAQHDPALANENSYWGNLECCINETEREIDEWERMHHQGIPSEAKTKEEELLSRRAKLAELKKLRKLPPFADPRFCAQPDLRTIDPSQAGDQQSVREVTTYKIKSRTQFLDAEIAKAKENAIDSADPKSVWIALVKLAESRFGCLLGLDEKTIKYQSGDDVRFFSLRNLRERMNRAATCNSARRRTVPRMYRKTSQ